MQDYVERRMNFYKGLKMEWDKTGVFQYHPSAHSNHGGAYWKVKNGLTGKRGTHYDLAGNEIKPEKSL